ncbi:hypothetical protein FIBSPDRAFT_826391 [Athelia psychrophila]|uniref:Uncharacterized protein n=1 Tax=Athelia psychrophila TaxID=1759441 RepID=A0A166JLT1_9AGAM|nr:hypothetical protein FIBSPDRAFT_826391 [Fibularhizoctonia sp. CBS 109695]
MKSTVIAAAVALLFASCVVARNCTPGLNYCGQTLVNIGRYQQQINQALSDADQTKINNGLGDLFHCVGGNNGDINWVQHCGKCTDGGAGSSDYCA